MHMIRLVPTTEDTSFLDKKDREFAILKGKKKFKCDNCGFSILINDKVYEQVSK
jgi:hypothetical protein